MAKNAGRIKGMTPTSITVDEADLAPRGPGKVYIGTDVGADPSSTLAVGSFTFLGDGVVHKVEPAEWIKDELAKLDGRDAHEFDLLAPESLRVQGTCCRECGASLPPGQPATHEMGCLTPAVEQGRMTPRERQIKLLEAEEARQARDPEKRLRDLIGEAGAGGQRIESLRMGTKAWDELAKTCPNSGGLASRIDPNSTYYMGYPIVVDPLMAPDAMEVLRAKPNVPNWAQSPNPASRMSMQVATKVGLRTKNYNGHIIPTVL